MNSQIANAFEQPKETDFYTVFERAKVWTKKDSSGEYSVVTGFKLYQNADVTTEIWNPRQK